MKELKVPVATTVIGNIPFKAMTPTGLEATVLTPHSCQAARLAAKPVNVIRSAKQVAHQA